MLQIRSMLHFSACIAILFLLIAKASANECTKLTATGNPEYPPYLFRENANSNKLIGANNEIIKLIAEKLNIEIEVIYSGPWSRAQKEVREGRIDLIAGAFFTIPRAQYMDYIYPALLTTKSVVWTNKNKPIVYSQKEDLINLRGITVINNSFGEAFDTFAKEKLTIASVPSLQQAFKMMNLGRADYLLYEQSPATAYISNWGIENQTTVVGPEISSEHLYLTLSHRSKCNTGILRGKLTKAIYELVSEGFAGSAFKAGHSLWQETSKVD